jgi:predicted DNA binding CopG/RHH family protein
MDERELKELQDEESWDDDKVRPAAKPQRAVVSVAFSRDDLERVATYAQQHGMETSEFIRRAALSQMTGENGRSTVLSVSGNVHTNRPRTRNKAPRSGIKMDEAEAFSTA